MQRVAWVHLQQLILAEPYRHLYAHLVCVLSLVSRNTNLTELQFELERHQSHWNTSYSNNRK